jgi:hypothetical protein
MPRAPFTFLTVSFALGLSSCVIGEPIDGGGGASGSEPAPAVASLFEPLAAPTPDRLAGVWSTTTTNSDGKSELRFRFAEGQVVGGVRCTFTSRNDRVITVGQVGRLTLGDVDAKQGQFLLEQELLFSETAGDLNCSGRLANVTWFFTITGTTLTLSAPELAGAVGLTKVGD